MSSSPYVIGLTGNIATGKSTVARMLGELGACVLDADKLAHETMRPGTPVYAEIVSRFGSRVQATDGTIDRTALGGIVFSDPCALRELEAIVHPAVVAETLRRIDACPCPIVVVEAIKLLEAHMHRHCDTVWVVTAPPRLQIARLVETRGLTHVEALRRINVQPAPELKLLHADVVIDNGGTLDHTRRQIECAWQGIPSPPREEG